MLPLAEMAMHSLMEDESQRFFICACRETKLEYIQGKIIANLGLTSITLAAGFMCVMMELLIYSPREQVLANQSLLILWDRLCRSVLVIFCLTLFMGEFGYVVLYGMRSIYLAYFCLHLLCSIFTIISQQFLKAKF